MAKKFNLTKKQVGIGVTVVGVILLAAGFGVLVRMLQQSGGTGTQTSEGTNNNKLPALISEVQDLQSAGKADEANKKIDEALANSATDNDTKYMLQIQKGNALVNNGDVQGGITEYLKAY